MFHFTSFRSTFICLIHFVHEEVSARVNEFRKLASSTVVAAALDSSELNAVRSPFSNSDGHSVPTLRVTFDLLEPLRVFIASQDIAYETVKKTEDQSTAAL